MAGPTRSAPRLPWLPDAARMRPQAPALGHPAMSSTGAPRPAPRPRLSLRAGRLLPVLLALVLAAGAAPLASPAGVHAADATVLSAAEAERRMLTLINQSRASAGLVSYHLDARLIAIARARTRDMAEKNYLSHTQPDGRKVFDLIEAARITWYGAGEIIAWNTWPALDSSAAAAHQGWLGSASHRAVVLSAGYNYIGIGVSRAADGKFYWAAVAIKGPDRTRPIGEMRRLARTTGAPRDGRYPVRISWAGRDPRLQVLTAGVRNCRRRRASRRPGPRSASGTSS
jgi:uncharacterized protein YkwD